MNENKNLQNNNTETTQDSFNTEELINLIPEQNNEEKTQNLDVKEEPQEEQKTNSLLFYFLAVFGVVFLSIFFLFNVYLTPISVIGQSMLPTINAQTTSNSDDEHNDMVYYREKNSYSYGDIVIISNESEQYIKNENKTERIHFLIKRIIACPGDTITFYLTDIDYQNHLYYYDISVKNSNGVIIDLNEESYIKEPMYIYKDPDHQIIYNDYFANIANNLLNDSLDESERKFSITLKSNCYFVMGDNRNNSSDSRSFGEVATNDICGNVRIQVKYGENIWIALFRSLKSYLSVSYNYLKENL